MKTGTLYYAAVLTRSQETESTTTSPHDLEAKKDAVMPAHVSRDDTPTIIMFESNSSLKDEEIGNSHLEAK